MKLIYRCLCLVLGSILGSGCSDNTGLAEYGMPYGKLRLDGRVTDDQGTPIPGVQVHYAYSKADTTDADGKWSINDDWASVWCATSEQEDCTVGATDIDGPDNGGTYQPKEVELDLLQTEGASGDWYQGRWEQHNIEIIVTTETPPEPQDPPKSKTEEDQ